MKFNIGDKVSFLNEKGTGTVRQIVSEGTVSVEVETGFEFNYPANELVLIKAAVAPVIEEEEEADDIYFAHPSAASQQNNKETKRIEQNRSSVFLSFEPEDERKLLNCPVWLYLYNRTDYDLIFTYNRPHGAQFNGILTNRLSPGGSILLEKIKRSDLEQLHDLVFQMLFYKTGAHELQSPVSKVIKVNPVKLYKESSFVKYNFISKRSSLTSVHDLNKKEEMHLPASVFDEKQVRSYTKLSKSHEGKLLEEIDLHIHELLEDTKGMSNAEMIQYQLNYFKKALDEAMVNKVHKLIVIHGVGNGRLKTEVRNILEETEGVKYHDASYAKYGFGATEVIIE